MGMMRLFTVGVRSEIDAEGGSGPAYTVVAVDDDSVLIPSADGQSMRWVPLEDCRLAEVYRSPDETAWWTTLLHSEGHHKEHH